VKPGKEELSDVQKYRPISLLNTGGKLLEKLLIDRINHHLHTNKLRAATSMDSHHKKVRLMQQWQRNNTLFPTRSKGIML
jgi:hypothetical protein